MFKLELQRLRRQRGRAVPFDQAEPASLVSRSQAGSLSFTQALHIWGQALYQEQLIYLDLHLSTEIELSCSRCLAPVRVPILLEQQLVLREEPAAEAEGLPIEEFFYSHHAKELELMPYLYSLILNSLEPKYLCKPGCRGLCPHCGQDLNLGACHCPPERRGDPRLTVLKKLLP